MRRIYFLALAGALALGNTPDAAWAMGPASESVFLFRDGRLEWIDLAGVAETVTFTVPFSPGALLVGPRGDDRGSAAAGSG